MIEDIQQTTGYGIRQICASLEVSRSSFYQAASPTATQCQDRRIGERIEAIFKRHRRRYGYRRIGFGTLRGGRGLRAGSPPPDHACTGLARHPAQNLRAQNQRWARR